MADVVLINPHWYMAQVNLGDLWLPIPNGLASVAAALRHQGHRVRIIDALAEGYQRREWIERDGRRICRVGLSEEVLSEKLKKHHADVVGIGSMFTAVFSASVECASIVRNAVPSARIVMGGVHPSCVPEEVVHLPEVDYVVRGEGEAVFPELIRHMEGTAAHRMPPGVFWKENGEMKTSGPPEIIRDINVLPMAAYDLLDMELYRNAARADLVNRGERGALTLPIITSRGCPYRCIFCAAHRLNSYQWRGRSAESVVDEIEWLHKQYAVHSFTIEDSNFSYDEERAFNICEEILRRGLAIRWNTPNGLRADRITPRLIQAMKRAGCYEITLAAEHGDQEFLTKVIRKNLDLGSIFRAGAIIRKAGLPVTCFLMMGFPGETEKELSRTVIFGRKLALAGIFPLFFVCAPFPGTAMHQMFVEKGCLPKQPLPGEEYLCALQIPLMKMPQDIDLCRWRHRAMQQACLLFLLRHPILCFRLPALRKFLASLISPKKSWGAFKKAYRQFLK